jgi:hypothetical protein
MPSETVVVDEPADGMTITRTQLVDRLGGAGAELFERLDRAFRDEDRAVIANVREARLCFSNARAPGHARLVKAKRPTKGRPEADEEMVLIGLRDLEAVVKANVDDFDWATVFAPRHDLPTASIPLTIRSGARGNKLKL